MDNVFQNIYDSTRQQQQYALDVESMNAYFLAYGFSKDTLTFNLLFPAFVDLRYVQ